MNKENSNIDYLQKLDRLVKFYEQLGPQNIQEMKQIYTEPTYFKDPFHVMTSVEGQLIPYFTKSFTKLSNTRFEFHEKILQGSKAVLIWDMHFEIRSYKFKIHGSSYIEFDDQGLVKKHRDYWDLAEELYDRLPFFGLFFRSFKKIFG